MGERAVWSDIKHLLAMSVVMRLNVPHAFVQPVHKCWRWVCVSGHLGAPTGGFVSKSFSRVWLTQILLLVKIYWASSESSDRHIVRLTLAFLCLWGPVAQLRLLSPLLRRGLCSLRGLCLLLLGAGREETSSLVQCEKAIMKECCYKEQLE